MKFDRSKLSELTAVIPNPRSPFFNLTEAIKREAFFMDQMDKFTKRELYMMMDMAYRYDEMTEEAMRSVDVMMKTHGI